jgi:hypothetical protein
MKNEPRLFPGINFNGILSRAKKKIVFVQFTKILPVLRVNLNGNIVYLLTILKLAPLLKS